MQFFNMQILSVSCYIVPLKTKYLPQHYILEHAKLIFFLNVTYQFLHPQKRTGKIKGLYILILIF